MTQQDTESRTWSPLFMTVVGNPVCSACGTHCEHSQSSSYRTYRDGWIACMRDMMGIKRIGAGHFETGCGKYEIRKRRGSRSWYYRATFCERSRPFTSSKDAISDLFMHHFSVPGTAYYTLRSQY
jgi:hypothetical protein